MIHIYKNKDNTINLTLNEDTTLSNIFNVKYKLVIISDETFKNYEILLTGNTLTNSNYNQFIVNDPIDTSNIDVGYYRYFITQYSELYYPLSALTNVQIMTLTNISFLDLESNEKLNNNIIERGILKVTDNNNINNNNEIVEYKQTNNYVSYNPS